MKNSLLNMVLVLGGITLIAAAGVGYVYRVTEEPIALAAAGNNAAALGEVLPAFDGTAATELTLDDIPMVVHTASAEGKTVGYAVETATNKGFSGTFRLMVGFTPEGRVRAVKVLEHSETPGLGSKMADAGNPLFASFDGRNPAEMKLAVRKDGGEVDALSAATITSRAYVDAIARAFRAMAEVTGGDAALDVSTDATTTDGTSGATKTDVETGATEQTDGATGATATDGTSGATATDSTTGATETASKTTSGADKTTTDNQSKR